MGNKRKASLVVFAVILAAVTVFSCVPFFIKGNLVSADDETETPAVDFVSATSIFGTGKNKKEEKNFNVEDGVYAIVFTGQQGGGGGGYGATCLTFYKGNQIETYIGGVNQSTFGYYQGGGYTKVSSNFALPVNQTYGDAIAGGGGGSYSMSSATQEWTGFLTSAKKSPGTPTMEYAHARFTGLDTDPGTSTSSLLKFVGRPGGTTSNGRTGYCGSSLGSISQAGVERHVYRDDSNARDFGWPESSAGGSGYTAGGGGGHPPTKQKQWNNAAERKSAYPGGGGTSSPNCYPVYATDAGLGRRNVAGNGMVAIYRLDPTLMPSCKGDLLTEPATIVDPTTAGEDRYTMAEVSTWAFGSDVFSNYIKTGWVYSTVKNSTDINDWKSASEIQNDEVLTSKTVYCRYVMYGNSDYVNSVNGKYYPCYNMAYTTAASAALDPNYVITEYEFPLIKYGHPSYVLPSATAESYFYDSEEHLLINAGSAINGTMLYSFEKTADETKWTADATAMKVTEPGEYTVYYYVRGNNPDDTGAYYRDFGSMTDPLGSITVTIKKVDPNLLPNTLRARQGLIFNDEYQPLFEGEAVIGNSLLHDKDGNGTIYYADVWTDGLPEGLPPSPTEANSNAIKNFGAGGSTNIADCTGLDARKSSDNSCVRYLYYRIDEGKYHEAVDWTLLTDENGVPITNNIHQVTLSLTATMMDPADYNAAYYQMVESVVRETNPVGYEDYFRVTYHSERTYVNKALVLESTSYGYTSFTSFQHEVAVQFDLYATWDTNPSSSAKSVLTPSAVPNNRHNYQTQEKKVWLGRTFINQIGNDGSNITIFGVPTTDNMSQHVIKLGAERKVAPLGEYKKLTGSNIQVDLKVFNAEFDNGITNNNISDNDIKNVNQLAFVFSKIKDPADVPADAWINTATADELNQKLLATTVDAPGYWYLHFKVLQHMNLKEGTLFTACGFRIYPSALTTADLTGINFTSRKNDYQGYINYDGEPHPVVQSGQLLPIDELHTYIDLVDVQYAVTDSSTREPYPTQWVNKPADLEKVTSAGTYYLWVRWGAKNNTEANTVGLLYGSFEIKPFNVTADENLGFSGINSTPAGWEQVPSTDYVINEKKFNNQPNTFGIITTVKARINGTNITEAEFGDFSFAYGTAKGPDKDFVDVDEFETLTVKDVGVYYLWVKWEGVENENGVCNIEPGQCCYKTYSTNNGQRNYVYQINRLEDGECEELNLSSYDFITSKGQVQYDYFFDTDGEYCWAEGKAQILFENTNDTSVSISVCGYEYQTQNFSIHYMVVPNGHTVTAEDEGWEILSRALAEDVGSYCLWVRIIINDANVSAVNVICLDALSAEIIPADSVVCEGFEPMALENLESSEDYDFQLIGRSFQDIPPVEYSLDGSEWTTDVAEITGRKPGTYFVYYRGATSEDGRFVAVEKPLEQYSYVEVRVSRAGLTFYPRPMAIKNVLYNGNPQVTFHDGKAVYQGNTIDLCYSWEEDGDYYSYEDFTTSHNKINVGRYRLYFDVVKNDYIENGYPESIFVEISKADIKTGNLIFNGANLTYKGADYPLIKAPLDYGLYDANNALIYDANGNEVVYSNRNADNWISGDMGAISYAVSLSSEIAPNTGWTESFQDVTARNVGTYYIWVKIAEGDSHNGSVLCCNINSPIVIKQLVYETAGCEYQNIIINGTDYTANNGLRYNGLSQKLINSLNLQIGIANRDDEGYVVLKENGDFAPEDATCSQINYNIVDISELGSVYYALSTIVDGYPMMSNFGADGWQSDWSALSKTDAGRYHLLIMIVSENFANNIKFSLSLILEEPEVIYIEKASKADLQISGLKSSKKVFTGEAQEMATGNLSVKIGKCDVKSDIIQAQYCYANPNVRVNDLTWVNSLAEAKVTEVGTYQLYIKLAVVTENIDTTEELIFALFKEGSYAEIQRVSINGLNVIAPEFAKGLVYNGEYQNLIKTQASLQMKNGTDLIGGISKVQYYISSSVITPDSNGTTKEGAWLDLADVQELNAGTYHIHVKFEEGASYNTISSYYVGTVNIEQVKAQNISLSGIEFSKEKTYNGKEVQLISGELKQTLIDSGLTIDETNYSKIEYAYSSNPTTQPNNAAWVDDIADLCAYDAGKYYLWVRVTGCTNGVTDVNNISNYVKCYYLKEEDYSEIYRADIVRSNIGGILLHEGLVYIGQEQVLASIPDQITIQLLEDSENLNTPELNDDLKFLWGLGTSAEKAPKTGWVSNLQKLNGLNSGDYYLWIKIQESKNFNEFKAHIGTISISKATIEVLNEPTVYENLSYKGEFQELIKMNAHLKFIAEGIYYGEGKQYYNAKEVVIEYSVNTEEDWTSNYTDVKGLNAGEYTIFYRVVETDNWQPVNGSVTVKIDAIDASTIGLGLVEAPRVISNLCYNEKAQDLISFGLLSTNLNEAGCGTGWEGSRFVFFYEDDVENKYEYYFNGEEYVWDETTGKLPGKTNVGTYTIKYYISASEKTNNYYQSEQYELTISIQQREISWRINPQAVNNFKHTGESQNIIIPGILNVGTTDPISSAKGVQVMYTMEDPTKGEVTWSETIPTVNKIGLFYVWYYVKVDDNNVFVGNENNSPTDATCITILVERNILVVVDMPRAEELAYTAEPQNLVNYYYLSTDATDAYGDKAPYIEYKLKNKPDAEWSRSITATKVGTYDILYRICYDPVLFTFEGNNGHDESLMITSKITPVTFKAESIRAICKADEYGNHVVTYEVAEEYVGNEKVALYTSTLMSEVEPYITYYYRKNDEFNKDQDWVEWENGKTKLSDTGMAKYEFKLEIIANDGLNFETYKQTGNDETPLTIFDYTEDRRVTVIMEDYNTPAYIRCWIDYTGTMGFDDAEGFRFEGTINNQWNGTFSNVYSNGFKNGAVIRLETTNNQTFYYISDRALTYAERRNISIESQKIKGVAKAVNTGLSQKSTKIYLYEVYHIEYNSNGGKGDTLTDGWKWHNIDYQLAENKFKKLSNGVYLEPNGWNTSSSGNGNNYNGAAMIYRENASQKFYARFFGQNDKFYTITWVIEENGEKYVLSREFRVWMDANNPENATRATGTLVLEGALITLPQIETDEFGNYLADIFGGHVLGWYTADDYTPYTIGMTAVRDMTFIAELNNDIDDYVKCEFEDANNQTVFDSGKIASGAEAYMALSGMDTNLMKDYQEGFDKWVSKYGYDYLERSNSSDGIFTYQLGTKTLQNTETKTSSISFIPMFVVLGLGITSVLICLVVYLVLRQNQFKRLNNDN